MDGRGRSHLLYLSKGKHRIASLQQDWNKDGREGFVFEVLEECAPGDLPDREEFWIEQLQAVDPAQGYNTHKTVSRTKQGPPVKEKPAWRPQLRLSESATRHAKRLGLDELSALIEWALPLWPGLEATAAQHSAAQERVTLRPSNCRALRPVAVSYNMARNVLLASRGERDDVFREVIQSLEFDWDKRYAAYARPVTAKMGSPVDRVAEVAAALYKKGWAVEVPSRELADLLIGGQYQLEQWRWVDVAGADFLLTWERGGGDVVWNATKSLPTARWDKDYQGSVVSWRALDDLTDFARQHGFAYTPAAQARLVEARLLIDQELIGVKLTPGQRPIEPEAPAAKTGEVTVPHDLLADDD